MRGNWREVNGKMRILIASDSINDMREAVAFLLRLGFPATADATLLGIPSTRRHSVVCGVVVCSGEGIQSESIEDFASFIRCQKESMTTKANPCGTRSDAENACVESTAAQKELLTVAIRSLLPDGESFMWSVDGSQIQELQTVATMMVNRILRQFNDQPLVSDATWFVWYGHWITAKQTVHRVQQEWDANAESELAMQTDKVQSGS